MANARRTTTSTTKAKTAPKKTTARTSTKSSKKTITPEDQVVDMSAPMSIQESNTPAPSEKMKVNRKTVGIIGGIILLAAVLYLVKGWFIVAIVNGEPISRFQVIRELEARGGKQILETEVYTKLVHQEADKRHVAVSQKEKDDWFKQQESDYAKQGKNLNDLLTQARISKADYVEQYFTLNKLLEKMVSNQVKDPADKEIADYIAKNKESLPTDKSEADLKKYVKDGLKQMALSDKVQTLQQEIEKNAKVTYWANY